jgi:hypothetical protein
MKNSALKLEVEIGKDRVIRLPEGAPTGRAEVIILFQERELSEETIVAAEKLVDKVVEKIFQHKAMAMAEARDPASIEKLERAAESVRPDPTKFEPTKFEPFKFESSKSDPPPKSEPPRSEPPKSVIPKPTPKSLPPKAITKAPAPPTPVPVASGKISLGDRLATVRPPPSFPAAKPGRKSSPPRMPPPLPKG